MTQETSIHFTGDIVVDSYGDNPQIIQVIRPF